MGNRNRQDERCVPNCPHKFPFPPPRTMPPKFKCKYCGSNRFKTLGGLKQHQSKSASCRDAYHHDLNLGICMATQENTMAVQDLSLQDQPLPRRSARVLSARDADSTANEHAVDASRNQAVGRNADVDGGTEENSMGQVENPDPPIRNPKRRRKKAKHTTTTMIATLTTSTPAMPTISYRH